ncbi:MAG: phage tail tape measure protein [Candidatus Caldarchaeum sp.]|nr:phage tail tape measure protein [Candidatus Caldarchaeum sp.]
MPPPNFTVKVLLKAEDQLVKTIAYARSQLAMLGETGVREAGRLESSFEILGSALKRAFGIALFEAGNYLQDFISGSVRAFAEFEASAVRLASLSESAGASVSALASAFRVAASAAAREMAVSGAEAMRALESLVKAGLSGAEAVNALRASLMMAKIEGEDYGRAASNLVQVMAQFGVEGSRAAYVVDVLVNASRLGIGSARDFAQGLANVGSVARAMGLSLEETTAWLVVLERRLGSAEEAGTQLARLLSSLYEIAGKLGVPIRDSSESLRSVKEIMYDVIVRTRQLGGDFEVLQNALSGVDVRAVRALFTLGQMSESFEELVSQVGKGQTALKAFEESLSTVEGRAAQLRAETDRLQRMVGESLSAIYHMVGPYVLKAFDAVVTSWRGIVAMLVGSKFDEKLATIETQLRVFGRISEEEASAFIRAWVEMGELTVEEALKIAEAVAIYDENIQHLIERALAAGETIPESFRSIAESIEQASSSAARLTELSLALERAESAASELSLASKALAGALDYYNVLARVNEALGISTELTEEHAESVKYLAATQSVVNYFSQLLTLQQQALQLYMMGAADAGNLLTNVMHGLGSALADGVVTQQEFVALLNVLGVDVQNVAGSLHNVLVKSLEVSRAAIEGNIEAVQSFSAWLNMLNGQTAHTYHYHHVITVTEGGGGGGGSSGGSGEWVPERYRLEGYQHGAWFTPEGPAYLHAGEMVLPRPVAEWFRRGGFSFSRPVNVVVNVNAVSSAGPHAIAEAVSRELVRRLRMI